MKICAIHAQRLQLTRSTINNHKRFIINQSVRVIFIITIRGYVEQPTPGAPIQLNFFHPCRYPNSTWPKFVRLSTLGMHLYHKDSIHDIIIHFSVIREGTETLKHRNVVGLSS